MIAINIIPSILLPKISPTAISKPLNFSTSNNFGSFGDHIYPKSLDFNEIDGHIAIGLTSPITRYMSHIL